VCGPGRAPRASLESRALAPRKLLLRAGLAALALVGALGAAELAVRALDLGPSFQVLHRELFRLSADPELGYELAPLAPDGDEQINSSGFRDREFERAKAPGVFRIVAVGDSVTFGQPKEPAESWPKALERELNARAGAGARFEVLNLGVTGYNGVQIARRLQTLGLAYEPDLVIYGYVLNDPQELSIELEALRDLEAESERRLTADLGNGALRLLARSRLFLLVRSRLAAPPAPAPGTVAFRHRRDPAYDAFQGGDERGAYFRTLHESEAGRERLRASLARMAEATRAAGVPLVLALFPLLLDPRAGPYPLADVHALVAEEARAQGLETIDLTPAFTDCARCAADFLHPNARGAEVAAHALAEALARDGRLPGPR
jgi:lysophospholipase L1-like esterase